MVVPKRRRPVGTTILAWALALVAVGFTSGTIRTALVMAPILDRDLRPTTVVGRVASVEQRGTANRITLSEVRLPERPDLAAVPGRVRVSLPAAYQVPEPGSLVRLRAGLRPPPGPVAPGAYDFGRQLFFAGIGAVGYAIGPPSVEAGPSPSIGVAVATVFERARRHVAERIAATLDGAAGGIAAALLAGEKGAVPEDAGSDMRASGLAHLLAISGLHVGLVAGMVFFAVRAGLALIESVALRQPIKKLAAVPALVAAVGYMLLVGAPVPTQRAALMTGLVLLAVLLDRNPFSMRLVAFAATAILLTAPESMLGPSFQMSFAAVIALVAGYEVIGPRWADWRAGTGAMGRTGLHFAGIAVTSLIAGAATLPFGLFHFQEVQFYGIAANLIAVPLTSLWVMPWGLVACIAMPFGLEAWPLRAMALGIEGIVRVARIVAGLPGATALFPAMPPWGLGLIAAGGLWLAIWGQRWRLLGLIPLMLGFVSIPLAPVPDLLVARDGRLVAIRDETGRITLSSGSVGRFDASIWLRRNGQEEHLVWDRHPASSGGGPSCDAFGCLMPLHGRLVSVAERRDALGEDCAVADVVIAQVGPRRCRA
ncbi:MAG TPA: ComEC/Rec2 family competence protein, partial [Arenibaculum sp.]|nr:ComEC/Rec2 family competence protein [Arenibaculum sp.]